MEHKMPNFSIRKDGVVQGGNASYAYEPQFNRLTYSATVKVKIGFFTKTQNFQGALQLPDGVMAWENFDEPGEQRRLGSVQLTVAGATASTAILNFQVLGTNVSGVANIERIEGGWAVMRSGKVYCTAYGLAVHLTLDQA
jgi:hypothetical protein